MKSIWDKDVEGLYREGEEVIADDSYWSYYYATVILKGRFRAGEKRMKKSQFFWFWNDYMKFLTAKGIKI